MKKALNIFLLVFYTCGTICLPMGDFVIIKDLPEMFRHCKANEDRDLNVFEFLTEHISPIGQLIEGVEHESEEEGDKPHEPIQSISCGQTTAFVVSQFTVSSIQFYHVEVKQHVVYNDIFFPSDYISKIFRPPLVA